MAENLRYASRRRAREVAFRAALILSLAASARADLTVCAASHYDASDVARVREAALAQFPGLKGLDREARVEFCGELANVESGNMAIDDDQFVRWRIACWDTREGWQCSALTRSRWVQVVGFAAPIEVGASLSARDARRAARFVARTKDPRIAPSWRAKLTRIGPSTRDSIEAWFEPGYLDTRIVTLRRVVGGFEIVSVTSPVY